MTNLFKKKFIRVPHLSTQNAFREIGRNAFVDWLLILILSVIVGGAFVAGGVYLYWQITTGNFKVADVSELSASTFSKDDLTSLTNHFQAREDMNAQIKRGYRGPVDPSF